MGDEDGCLSKALGHAQKLLLDFLARHRVERAEGLIEQQHRRMEQTLSMPVAMPQIRTHASLTQSGLEMKVRYPVDVEHAADIDDQVTRELMDTLKRAPELKLAGSGMPSIQVVSDENKAA